MGTTASKVPFVVGDLPLPGAVGLLGQNVFRIADVEYDLANGVIRLVRTKDCRNSSLAYWAGAAGKPYSVMNIESADEQDPHTRGIAFLNGTKIHVTFDTGSPQSLLTLAAAKRAGITPQSEGVRPGGDTSLFGGHVLHTWIARFASFKVGDEEIENARLRIGDADLLGVDMLIGADFFLSHRVYVASGQHKLYFTYNGGPVFDLDAPRTAPASADSAGNPADPAAAAAAGPPATTPPDKRLDEPADAAGFSRRALASAARHDYAAALADLDRACELAPADASYRYQRGFLHWQNRQPELALADFDQAIILKPDDVSSLVMRASLRSARHDASGAAQDLDTADRVTAKNSDVRLSIASAYEALGNLAAARQQLSMWVDTHPRNDLRMPEVLNSRCWFGALSGQGLDQALADCNTALKLVPKTAAFLDSRGLVHLRRGDFDQAIADYDAALRIQPRIAWSLYGRGLAKLRKGQSAAGQADLRAATALEPKIAARAAKLGLTP